MRFTVETLHGQRRKQSGLVSVVLVRNFSRADSAGEHEP
jgi:hypothetical protein